MNILFEPGQVVELRVPGTSQGTVSGYFDNHAALEAAALELSGTGAGVYVTLNPINPALLARRGNRVEGYIKSGATTTDVDIVRRRWLPIDLDAKRPAGISATDAEHEAALDRASQVAAWLTEQGWPEPIVADSGNGGHLLYRIDLPNDAESLKLVKAALAEIGSRFGGGSPRIEVDQTVSNAARIWKAYGTLAAKGDSTPDRPHRVSRILSVPATVEIVTAEQMAALTPKPEGPTKRPLGRAGAGEFSLDAWLEQYAPSGVGIGEPKLSPDDLDGDKTIRVLDVCPFDPSHDGGSAYVGQKSDGTLFAGCHHNSCVGWGWAELRAEWQPVEEPEDDTAIVRVSAILQRPPVEWWPGLEGLLQKGVTSEIVAASGGGKSLWTLQHCVDLAQRGIKVLYCALEGQAGFTGRLRAQIQERCVPGIPGLEQTLVAKLEENLLFYSLRVALSGGDVEQSVARLRGVAEKYGSDIIIIDTLIRAAPGVDENDNAQMQGVVDSADELRYKPDLSVWLIRHAGHDQNRGRGASSVYAALDNSVFISPIGNHDGKDGRPLVVRVRADKVKDGRQAHGLIYRRHELVLGTLHDGSDWTSVVFRPEREFAEDQDADWTMVLELIDRYDDGAGMTSAQIRQATQWSTGKVGKVLKEMAEAGVVVRSKEGKGSFVYSR